jgi:hypothetical protein
MAIGKEIGFFAVIRADAKNDIIWGRRQRASPGPIAHVCDTQCWP